MIFPHFLTLLLLCISTAVPIPPRYDGYTIGNSSAPIQFEAYYDLMCPDCRESWPVMKQVINHYRKDMYFILHRFPLPYHHNSYYSNWMAGVVYALGSPSSGDISTAAIWKWVDAIFKNQDSYGNGVTGNETANDLKERMGKLAISCCGISNMTAFTAAWKYHSPEEEATRVSWKFGAGARGISGTPTFQVNGVTVENADPSWSLEDWQKVFDPLLMFNV